MLLGEEQRTATRKQLWALYCLTKKDYRQANLTIEQASALISEAMAGKGQQKAASCLNFDQIANEIYQAVANAIDRKVKEYQGHGFAIAVVENDPKDCIFYNPAQPTKVVGGLYDVCGFADIRISCREPIYNLAKKYGTKKREYLSFINLMFSTAYPKGCSIHLDFDMERAIARKYPDRMQPHIAQALGMKTTYYKAVIEVLTKHGLVKYAWIWTHVD